MERTQGTIILPGSGGQPEQLPTDILSVEDAKLLRAYKAFLERMGWKEALYCSICFGGSLHDGMDVFVTPGKILAKCRHRMVYYEGTTN